MNRDERTEIVAGIILRLAPEYPDWSRKKKDEFLKDLTDQVYDAGLRSILDTLVMMEGLKQERTDKKEAQE